MPAKGTRGGRSDAQIQHLAEARSKNPDLSSMTSDAASPFQPSRDHARGVFEVLWPHRGGGKPSACPWEMTYVSMPRHRPVSRDD
jgi:hypothetical protein